jgi:hypothetical protein
MRPEIMELLKDLKPLAAGFEEGWDRNITASVDAQTRTIMRLMYMLGANHVLTAMSHPQISAENKRILFDVMNRELDGYSLRLKDNARGNGQS